MNDFVTCHNQHTQPSPIPGYSWAAIDMLEASLMVSVVATSAKLHELIQEASPACEPQLLLTTKQCLKRYSDIMASAHSCCNVLNKIRDGTFKGDPTTLKAVLRALKYVRDEENPILLDSQGGLEDTYGWTYLCSTYVENVVKTIEHIACVLQSTGSA